jgi:hypothetical protein
MASEIEQGSSGTLISQRSGYESVFRESSAHNLETAKHSLANRQQ